MTANIYELTPGQWEIVAPLLPPERTGKAGRPCKDNRMMLNGMIWVLRSGASWRSLNEDKYGSWKTMYSRFTKWSRDGTFDKIFKALSKWPELAVLSIDSTYVKLHKSANGGGKKRG